MQAFRETSGHASRQGTASKLLDNACMTIAPRSHQNSVRHLAAIVQNGVPRQRSHATIRFLHDQIGRCKVPIRGFDRPQKQHQACHPRHGIGEAPATRCADEAKFRHRLRLSRSTSGFGPAMRGKSSAVPDVAWIGVPLSCDPRPCSRKKELVAGRRKYRGQHRLRIFDQRDADAPVFTAGKIGARTVDRIDDPYELAAETRFVIGAFLGQPAIVRRTGSESLGNQFIDRDIGFRHRR